MSGRYAGSSDFLDRFWLRVHIHDGGCWEWQASLSSIGYGQIMTRSRRPARTHRIAMSLYSGRDLSPSEKVLHSCDNPRCVNPDHLRIGDQSDNLKDAYDRGRHPIIRKLGEDHWMTGRTHCNHGHEFNMANTGTRKGKNGKRYRICMVCKRIRWHRYRQAGIC